MTEEREAPASTAALSGAKPPPSDIHAGPDWWGLCYVRVSAALFPYIVNEEGIPLCARFQSAFQNSIGNEADFQRGFIGLDMTGPGTVLGSCPLLFQDVDERGSLCRKSSPNYQKRAGVCTFVSSGLSIENVYRELCKPHLRFQTTIQ